MAEVQQQQQQQQQQEDLLRDVTASWKDAQGIVHTDRLFTDGPPQPASQVMQAAQQYANSGGATVPPGFMVFHGDKPEEMATASRREAYNTYIADPVHRAYSPLPALPETVQEAMGRPAGSTPTLAERLMQPTYPIARNVANIFKGMVVDPTMRALQSPEEAAGMAGQTAATAATGTFGLPTQMAAAGAGGALGRLAGAAFFGDPKKREMEVGNAITYGGFAALARGALGGAEWLLGQMPYQRIAKDTQDTVINLAKKDYPQYMNDPNIMAYAMDNADFARRAVQAVSQGIRSSFDEASEQLRLNMNYTIPGLKMGVPGPPPGGVTSALTPEARATLRDLLSQVRTNTVNAYESINNPKDYNQALADLNTSRKAVMDFAEANFPNEPAILDSTRTFLEAHEKDTNKLLGNAAFARALEQSNAGSRFDPGTISKTMQDFHAMHPGSSIDMAYRAARLGEQSNLLGSVAGKINPQAYTGLSGGIAGLAKTVLGGTGHYYGPTGFTSTITGGAGPLSVTLPVGLGTAGMTEFGQEQAGKPVAGAVQSGKTALESFVGGKR